MEIRGTGALVTGAASGLGAATAALLAERGARVVGLDLERAIERAEPVDGVELVAGDVTSADDVRAAIAAVPQPLRIAIHCAGIGAGERLLGRDGPHGEESFERVLAVNVVGTFQVLRLGAEAMAATEPLEGGHRGVIVQTASVAAFDGQIGQVAYSASKGAVAAMTLPAARDLARSGIRVMTIAPGIVDTPMMAGVDDDFRAALEATVPFPARLARPAEYAQLACAIVEHDYLNGETIRMDGALRMPPR